jgi:hypothetical protein
MTLATSLVHLVFVVVIFGLYLSFPIICAMKGKWLLVVVGLFVPLCWLVGALRLAKPGSFWARTRYDDAKMGQAQERFPGPLGSERRC